MKEKMTPAQKKAVKQIRETVLRNDGHSDNYEYKKFEVKLLDFGKVQVLTEVGRVGDEGTMDEIFARTRQQIFVGKRGGLTLCNPAKFIKKDDQVKVVPLGRWIKGRKALYYPAI